MMPGVLLAVEQVMLSPELVYGLGHSCNQSDA